MTYNQYIRKYEQIEKSCPVCGKKFMAQKGHKREKATCSYSCSNTFFANRRNKPERYKRFRTICFKIWPKKCILCGFDIAVDVHHIDEGHDNNDKNNLVPLCPNHHVMIHHKSTAKITKKELESKLRGVA